MVWLPRQQFHSSLKVFEAPIQWRVGMSHTAEWVDAAALAYKEERERRRWVGEGKEGACCVIRMHVYSCLQHLGLPTYGMKCVGQWKCSTYFVKRHSNFAVHFKDPTTVLCKARPNIASNRYLCGQYSMTAVWCCVVLCGDVWCCVVLCGAVW